ncbi:MAG: hypothetical protein ACTHKS_15810 [Gaiellaceae bacterium]
MDAPSRTKAADLAVLRERLDELGRRRVEALARPAITSCAVRQHQLQTMRFDLAEVEWHLSQLESN